MSPFSVPPGSIVLVTNLYLQGDIFTLISVNYFKIHTGSYYILLLFLLCADPRLVELEGWCKKKNTLYELFMKSITRENCFD